MPKAEIFSMIQPWTLYTHRIHVWYIYANIGGILMGSMLPYIAYIDPMGYICRKQHTNRCSDVSAFSDLIVYYCLQVHTFVSNAGTSKLRNSAKTAEILSSKAGTNKNPTATMQLQTFLWRSSKLGHPHVGCQRD